MLAGWIGDKGWPANTRGRCKAGTLLYGGHERSGKLRSRYSLALEDIAVNLEIHTQVEAS